MFPLKDNLRYLGRPTVTTLIIVINCLFFIIEQALLNAGPTSADIVNKFGVFSPLRFTEAFANAEPLSMLLTTCSIFTAMFLHDGIMHILGNMIFLSCFGRAVEAHLGKRQYICFYLVAGVAAAAGQYLTDPWCPSPLLGASGAIAGVLSAYLMLFPKARIAGVSVQLGILYAPAWSYLLSWLGIQVFSQIFESSDQGGVAYMAHIGGFAFGVMVGIFARWLTPVNGLRYADGSPTKPRFSGRGRIAKRLVKQA